MNFKKKVLIKNVIYVILIVLALIAVIGVIFSLTSSFNKDDKKTLDLDWKIGNLDSKGRYIEDKRSIYTEESFLCTDLEIELDFDSNITYKVFFFDKADRFISNSISYDESSLFLTPENAKFARIVITPKWSVDDIKDEKIIKWFQISKYSKQLDVKIAARELKSYESSLDIYKITSTNSDELEPTEVNIVPNYIGSENSLPYILYLKSINNNYFEIVGTSKDESEPLYYNYALVVYTGCSDKIALEAIKFLTEAKDFSDYYVYLNSVYVDEEYSHCDVYFSKDDVKLDKYISLLN